jgi:asparagine synthase (glutamine-hydrolysing)
MVVQGGEARARPYWRVDYPGPDAPVDEERAVLELRHLLTDAIRLRLRSDVPVGAYLSGGLDSSLTSALIKGFTDTPLKTFSVAFSDREYDESEYQKLVIADLHTEHLTAGCTSDDIGRVFADVVWHAETPIIRTAPAPFYLLSKLVRESGFKVVVTGEGADEVFGGYDIFKEAKIRRFWQAQPDSRFRPLLLRRLYPYMPALQAQPTPYLKAFFHLQEGGRIGPFFSHVPRWELTARIKELFSDDVRHTLQKRDATAPLLASLPEDFERWHPFFQAQFLETTILLPGYILSSQGDRVGMAHSVEGRFPFLDHRVVAFASRLPPHLKMRVLDEKYLLKRAAEGLVPAQVIRRPKQPYRAPDVPSFFLPAGGGARFEYVRSALSDEAVRATGIFAPAAVAGLVRKCERGASLGVKDSMALVGVLSTQLLLARFNAEFRGASTHGRD